MARKCADQLPAHLGRIGQRAQQIKDRAGAEFHPRAGGVAQRRVMAGGKQEHAAGALENARQAIERRVDIDAEGCEHIRTAGA